MAYHLALDVPSEHGARDPGVAHVDFAGAAFRHGGEAVQPVADFHGADLEEHVDYPSAFLVGRLRRFQSEPEGCRAEHHHRLQGLGLPAAADYIFFQDRYQPFQDGRRLGVVAGARVGPDGLRQPSDGDVFPVPLGNVFEDVPVHRFEIVNVLPQVFRVPAAESGRP